MKKILLALLFSALYSVSASASAPLPTTYQFEGDFSYIDGEADDGADEEDEELWSIGIAYHFQMVDPSNGPWAEAAFLEKASHIGFRYSDGEFDTSPSLDYDQWSADGRFVHVPTGLFVSGGYGDGEIEIGTPVFGIDELDIENYQIELGFYVLDNATLSLQYGEEELEVSGDELEYETIAIRGKYVGQASGIAYAAEGFVSTVDVEGDGGFDEDGEAVGIALTFYPQDNIGIGASFVTSNVDGSLPLLNTGNGANSDSGDSWSVYGEWFATSNIALNLAYEEFEYDEDFDIDEDRFVIGVRVRF